MLTLLALQLVVAYKCNMLSFLTYLCSQGTRVMDWHSWKKLIYFLEFILWYKEIIRTVNNNNVQYNLSTQNNTYSILPITASLTRSQ